MAVVKVEEVSVESLLAHITHVDVQYALWCIKSGDSELIKEGKRLIALWRGNARHLIAFIDAARNNSNVDQNLANDVRRAALLAAGSVNINNSAVAYMEMVALFSELMRPSQPFVAQLAFRAL